MNASLSTSFSLLTGTSVRLTHHAPQHGYYNGGMLWFRSVDAARAWGNFTRTSRFFDQAAIDDLVAHYRSFEFSEGYNVQAWRWHFAPEGTHAVRDKLRAHNNGSLFYGPCVLKSVHTHFRDRRFAAFNAHVKQMLQTAARREDLELIRKLEVAGSAL